MNDKITLTKALNRLSKFTLKIVIPGIGLKKRQEKALMMKNVDGTEGEHWDHEQTTNVARNNGIKFDTYNSWDWYYVMNMLYSDMCKIFGKDAGAYAKAAEAWLEDEDVAEGKAFRYYAKVVMC
jgi:hypothetical protein